MSDIMIHLYITYFYLKQLYWEPMWDWLTDIPDDHRGLSVT